MGYYKMHECISCVGFWMDAKVDVFKHTTSIINNRHSSVVGLRVAFGA